jgi:hypothetical protein
VGDWWKREKEGGRKKGERDKRGAGGGGDVLETPGQNKEGSEAPQRKGRESKREEQEKGKKERDGNLGHQRNKEKTSSSFFRSATATIFGRIQNLFSHRAPSLFTRSIRRHRDAQLRASGLMKGKAGQGRKRKVELVFLLLVVPPSLGFFPSFHFNIPLLFSFSDAAAALLSSIRASSPCGALKIFPFAPAREFLRARKRRRGGASSNLKKRSHTVSRAK